jgi:DNA-directed RNA polymerase subunit L
MTETKANNFENNDYDIKIKQKEMHKSNGLDSHYLKLELEGDDMNIKIVNMLRRACSNNIPVYAYALELINIIQNSSIAFNNDMMKLDLSLLPIYNVDPEIYDLEEEYWYNVNYADKERKIHHNEQIVEFYLKHDNNSADIVRVTTNDAQVYIDGKQVEMYDKKYPILIIELKENQSFQCHMKGVLGVADRRDDGALWKACKRSMYEEISGDDGKKKYELTVVGNEQFSEYELLIRTCKFLILKLKKIKKMTIDKVIKKEINPENTIKFVLENEDHTIGEPINFELQDHKDIVFSGFAKPDHLIKTGTITASCIGTKESPINAFINSIDILINKINKIGYLLTNLASTKKKNNKENDIVDSEEDDVVSENKHEEEKIENKKKNKNNKKDKKDKKK